MAYFKYLAADLDRTQPSGHFTRYVKKYARYVLLPFDLADEIAQVPRWPNLTKIDRTNTTYLAKLGKWLANGIDFDPGADDCCEQAEQFLVESIRRDQHDELIDHRSLDEVQPQPAVIFTVGGVAVAYRKSVGVPTIYGLRDSKEHNIGAEMFATHNFADARLTRLGSEVVTYELARGQTFEPIRPAVTSFDLVERELFTRYLPVSPLEHAALTLSHETTVRDVDAILREQNEVHGRLSVFA